MAKPPASVGRVNSSGKGSRSISDAKLRILDFIHKLGLEDEKVCIYRLEFSGIR